MNKFKDLRDEQVKLQDLIWKQRELMARLDIDFPVKREDLANNLVVKDGLIMLAGEVMETLDYFTVATKPWKQLPDTELRELVLGELVDCLFFIMELFILMGSGAGDIEARYSQKWQVIVHERIKEWQDGTKTQVPEGGLQPGADH